MGPCAIPLEDRGRSNVAVNGERVCPGEHHREHVGANAQQCSLMGRRPYPGPCPCTAGAGPSAEEMLRAFCFMHPLAAPGAELRKAEPWLVQLCGLNILATFGL